MPPIDEKSTDSKGIAEPTLDGAFSDEGIDLTVIRWMLRLTPAQRLQSVQDLIDTASAFRSADDDARATRG